mgnify:CR=1 FL=1
MKKILLLFLLVIVFIPANVFAFCTEDSQCASTMSCPDTDVAKCVDAVCECVLTQVSTITTAKPKSSAVAPAETRLPAGSGIGGTTQTCWELDKCKEVGTPYGPNTETIGVCGTEKNALGKEIVFCSPGLSARTSISYAGTRDFANIGEYINFIYRYGVMAAGILAVFMIITAGFQWTMSGGSAEKITSAKKRIGGALMGLFLVSVSFFILNTINPYLVNLRLPQTWMINAQKMTPVICDQLESGKVATAYTQGEVQEMGESKITKQFVDGRYTGLAQGAFSIDPKVAHCGDKFFTEDGMGLTCLGMGCDPGNVCVTELTDIQTTEYTCKEGMIAGKISSDRDFLCTDLGGNIFDNNLLLIAMCKDGDIEKVWDKDLPDSARSYIVPFKRNLETICGSPDNLAGFYFGGEVNDEGGGLFGSFCPGVTGSSGCDDWHAIGKSVAHRCNINLGKLGTAILTGTQPSCGGDNVKACACSAISDEPNVKELAKNPSFVSHLISLEDIKSGGYVCDIEINRSDFPGLDNSSSFSGECSADDDTDCWDDQNSF